jgi:P-type conjugative transfer protein TrbJ
MRRFALSIVWALAIGFAAIGPVRAQMAVFDPANFQQNLLTAARTLEQVNLQMQQLQNEAQMLANQARNLQPLDMDSLARLRAALARTEQLLEETRDLSFDVTQAQREFARLYPERYVGEVDSGQLDADALERWNGSLEALRTAVRLQAQVVGNIADDEVVLSDLVGASQSAAGALQAAQATNQLLALQAKQLIQVQQLQAVHGRATALEQARTVVAEERARALRRRFMTPRTPYTGEPVQLFGEGGDW